MPRQRPADTLPCCQISFRDTASISIKLCSATEAPVAQVARAGLQRVHRGEIAIAQSIEETLVDVTPLGTTGREAEALLDDVGITVNKNAIPFDTLPPNTASGIRIGTPATTSRGFGPDEMRAVGRIIIEAIRQRDDPAATARLAGEVTEIVGKLQAQKKRSVLLFVERQGDPRFAALRLTK